jgi:hypothetical protein
VNGHDPFLARLRQRGEQLAARFLRAAQGDLASRWRARAVDDDDGIGLAAPGLGRRRRGTRTQLPDADLLWPGRE